MILTRSIHSKIWFRKINGLNFIYDLKYIPDGKSMFFGLYQPEVIAVLLKYLKKGGTFIDIGASIGYITGYGASLVGKEGKVISFEPLPESYKRLTHLSKINKKYKISTENYALGELDNILTLNVSKKYGVGWNTLIPNWITSEDLEKKIEVPVRRLDEFLEKNNINDISLIKIDVEGFEFSVLKGLSSYFEKKKRNLPPIILEVVQGAYHLLGNKIEDLETFMKKYSYIGFRLDERSIVDFKNIHPRGWEDILYKQIILNR
ncbi:MAG: FkbM family methyltransferase [Candidatus Lokiarchaeota archaeon]|nr:FkbM family methyltransferase [Candidatus Lokiarchaeota archaeon]